LQRLSRLWPLVADQVPHHVGITKYRSESLRGCVESRPEASGFLYITLEYFSEDGRVRVGLARLDNLADTLLRKIEQPANILQGDAIGSIFAAAPSSPESQDRPVSFVAR
jgi:hypothetical protein